MKAIRLLVLIAMLLLSAGCARQQPLAPTASPPAYTPTPTRNLTPTAPPPTDTPYPTATLAPATTRTPTRTARPTPTTMTTHETFDGVEFWTYGGARNDNAVDVLLLEDGGMLLAGMANNPAPSHRITTGNARLVRTDASGQILWQKDYGGELDAAFEAVIQAGEDAYVVVGTIAASYERNETDIYLVEVDGDGNQLWSQTFGGFGMDHGKRVIQAADGGFVITGSTADSYVTGNLYQGNVILIKTDAGGNELWTHTYGEKILYVAWAVNQAPDGGFVVTGWEARTIEDRDVIVLKTDPQGTLEWSRSWDLDPNDRDGGFDSIVTSDGSIVVACIRSMDSGTIGATVIKLDLQGNELWQRSYGAGSIGNQFWDIMEDADGGYVLSGVVIHSVDPTSGRFVDDGWIVKLDPDGDLLWEYVFAPEGYEQVLLSAATLLPDGSYVFVGAATRSGEAYSDILWLKYTRPPNE
jgi:hypothetical protein